MSDGARTRDHRDHNPELYQLSYAHQAGCVRNLAARQGAKPLDRHARSRYNKCNMLVMLVETRGPFDDGEGSSGSRREPWLVSLLAWLLPWPALIIWLCVASRVIDGWLSVICIFTAIWLTAWRGLRALPTEGLNEVKQ